MHTLTNISKMLINLPKYVNITKSSNSHWCSRRKKRCIKSQGLNFWTEWMCTFFLFCLHIILFAFSPPEATEDTCFPEDKISSVYPNLQMHRVSFGSISERLNHTVIVGKGSNMQKMLENQRICGTWRKFLKYSRQFVQDKQGTHEQLSQKKKKSCGSSM